MADNYLSDLFEAENLPLTEHQYNQFQTYYELLSQRNQVMNLTAITDWKDVCIKHFLDSVMLWKNEGLGFNEEMQLRMVDVGTGAGFPGLPLKIMKPEIHLTLLDALQKRIDFLDDVVRACGLSDVETVHGRAEDVVKTCRESFDLAVSRAVAYLPVLSEYCLPFVKTGGVFAAYKSGDIEEELKASEYAWSTLGGKLEKTDRFVLPDGSARSIILIRKEKETPEKYPRRPKKIEKEPLVG